MKKRRGNTRGETLVETVVSFAVLMVMLAMLATVMRSAARMNQHAALRAEILEQDCTRVEQNAGVYRTDGANSDTLRLQPKNGLGEAIEIALDVRSCEILHYFRAAAPAAGAGGGG